GAAGAGGSSGSAGSDDGGPPVSASDLIKGQSWSCLEGTKIDGTTLVMTPTGREIIATSDDVKLGVLSYPNPPLNLRGPSLNVSGDFQISATLSLVGGGPASLTLNGVLPIIQDEWRQEGTALVFGLKGGSLEVAVWNQSPKPTTQTFGTNLPS